ncbi:MAG: UvrB/UvrC motif-containing protein, partial [Planctomycetota bacterium]
DFYKNLGHEELISRSGEIAVLGAFAKEIEGRIPVDPLKKLQKALNRAVRQERYEEAAKIRDKLRKHGEGSRDAPPKQEEN